VFPNPKSLRLSKRPKERRANAEYNIRSPVTMWFAEVLEREVRNLVMVSEESLKSWANAPGQTEQTKCDNAVNAIRKAKDASPALAKRAVRPFAQGSYCNRTNVRQDSDVDVCVLCADTFFFDLPEGMASNDFNISTPATYQYSQYKTDVGAALTSYFANGHVVRGNKAFDIKENTYRIAADAVPCFEYRRYFKDGSVWTGVAFQPDSGPRIVNWPEQNYDNGVEKNTATGQRFKDVVRILKRLRYKMLDENVDAAKNVPSFLIECLVFNAPNELFQHTVYRDIVRDTLAHLFNNTIKLEDCNDWREINRRKYLFRGQAWTFQQVHSFLSAAWDYIGFD
jgi:hypothetical protein